MSYSADPKPIRIITGDGKFLFSYDPATRTIEIVERGETFHVPMWMIQEHVRTSQRDTIRVYAEKDQELPCGHTEGTVLNAYFDKVCAVCGQ